MCGESTVFCWISELPAVLAPTGRKVRFNFAEGSIYVYIVWKILSFKCSFCNY